MPDSPPAAVPAQSLEEPNALSTTRYLAWLYTPPSQQRTVAALCEIESEIVSSIRPGIDHHVAHARLQWWREECERSARGRPVHPLTRKLIDTYGDGDASRGVRDRNTSSPLEGICGFVDTAVWDLAAATFETRKELATYCERWAAAMFQTVAALNGAGAEATSGASAVRRWRMLGAAVREIELLSDLAGDAHVGRLRIPLDELERAGVEHKALSKPPWPAALVDLLRERHQALRASIGDSLGAFENEEQADFRGMMVWATLAWRQSVRAQRALPNVVQARRYDALSDGWQAWRAARRAANGKLRLS
jgi:phytoene synthase